MVWHCVPKCTLNINEKNDGSINRKMTILKVETDIITSIHESPIGRAMILLIMYAETFKTGVIAFISYTDITMCSRSLTDRIISSIRICSLILKILLDAIKGEMAKLLMKINIITLYHIVWCRWLWCWTLFHEIKRQKQ